MLQRIISGLVIAALFIPPVFLSDKRWLIAVGLVVVVLATQEYIEATNTSQVFFLFTPALYLSVIFQSFVPWVIPIYLILTIGFLLFASIFVIQNRTTNKWTHVIFMTLFLGIGAGAIVYLDVLSFHALVYLVFIIAFTDIFAYFFGIKFGKHKLAPLISPKKSIEGLIAGTIIGASTGILYTQLRPVPVVSELPLLWIIGLSILLSLLGQLGDLFASKIKRAQNIKDFGDLFPGHGGLLDRFDSLCMSALLYFIIVSL